MSLETLAIAADFVESAVDQSPTRGGHIVGSRRFHAYSKQPQIEYTSDEDDDRRTLSSSGCADDDDLWFDQSGPRAVHNKLEKNRRAHLKDCFRTLKSEVPSLGDKKMSNLTILRAALKYIQTLKRKERELLHEKQSLKRDEARRLVRVSELWRELRINDHDLDRSFFRSERESDEETRSTSTATADTESPIMSDVEDEGADYEHPGFNNKESSPAKSFTSFLSTPTFPETSTNEFFDMKPFLPVSTKPTASVTSAIANQLNSTTRTPVAELLHQTVTQRIAAQKALKESMVDGKYPLQRLDTKRSLDAPSNNAIPAYIMTGSRLIPGNILIAASTTPVASTTTAVSRVVATTLAPIIKTSTPTTQSVVVAGSRHMVVDSKCHPASTTQLPLNFIISNPAANSTINAHIAAITKLANAAGSQPGVPNVMQTNTNFHPTQFLFPTNVPLVQTQSLSTRPSPNIPIIPPILSKSTVVSSSVSPSQQVGVAPKCSNAKLLQQLSRTVQSQTFAQSMTTPTYYLTNSGIALTPPSNVAPTTTINTNSQLNTTLLTLLRTTTACSKVSNSTSVRHSTPATVILQPHGANLAALNPVLSQAIAQPVSITPTSKNNFTLIQQPSSDPRNITLFQSNVNAQPASIATQQNVNKQNITFLQPAKTANALQGIRLLQPNSKHKQNVTFTQPSAQQNITLLQPIVDNQHGLPLLQQTLNNQPNILLQPGANNCQNVSLLQLLTPNMNKNHEFMNPTHMQQIPVCSTKATPNQQTTTMSLSDFLKKANVMQQMTSAHGINQAANNQVLRITPQTTANNQIVLNPAMFDPDSSTNVQQTAINNLLAQQALQQIPLLSSQLMQTKQIMTTAPLLKPVLFLSLTSANTNSNHTINTINSTVGHLT